MVLITKLDFTDFQNYREEFHKCLLLNNDNNKIKKIFVFVELNIDNLPKLSKVQYIVKRGYSSEQIIDFVKKLTQEEKFIFSSPFYILGRELSQNEFQKIVTQKNNYSIFFRDTNYKLINLNPCHDGSLFNKKVNFTQILPKEEPNVIRKKGELVQTHIQSSNNNFNVIIVSVNYNDYLLVSLDQNIKIFQNITVVTSQEDVMCQRICEKFGVNCVITEKMYEGDAKFNKGKAINEGIKSISNPGWILLLDADIVVEGELSTENLDKSSLYTSDRYLCEEYTRFKSYKSGILHIESLGNFEPNKGLGFFQLFHTSKENRFPETSDDAAWSDLMFRDKFTSRKKIENRVIHLGQAYTNWEGRATDRFLTDEEFHKIFIKQSTYTICSYYFNFRNDIRQKENFIKFLDQFNGRYDKMIVGIVDYGDIDFEIPCKSIVIKGESEKRIWSKEILINKIIDEIDTDYLIWIDGDLIYEDLSWLDNIDSVVKGNDFVQLFETINYLGENGEILETHKSIMSSGRSDIDNLLGEGYKPGGAWLGKTSILKKKKLFEQMYVGGGDTIFVYGLFGITDGWTLESVKENNEIIHKNCIDWIDRLDKFDRNKITNLNLIVNHLFHGELNNRNYNNRYTFLRNIGLNSNENLSIIVTAFNSVNYIKETLDSISNQEYLKYMNFEILIGIDNCKETLKYLLKIKNNYKNLRIFFMNENKGTYITSNTLIKLTKYENIIRFDSDDIMLPNMIEKLMTNKNDYDLIRYGFQNFSAGASEKRTGIALGSHFITKKSLEKLGGYKPWPCSADRDLICRACNLKILEINEILFKRRIHSESLTRHPLTNGNSEIRKKYNSLISTGEEYVIPVINNNFREIKNKICFIYDVEGWAFFNISSSLQRYLEPQFEVELKKYDDIFDSEDFDLIICFSPTVLPKYSRDYNKIICGISSHKEDINKRLEKFEYVFTNDVEIFNNLEKNNKFYNPNGIDTEVFSSILSERTLDKNYIKIGTIGSIQREEHKGKYRIKKITDMLISIGYNVIDVSLFVDPYSEKLNTKQMIEYYENIDIFIISSVSETGPNTLLEAMSCGVPVVANKTGLCGELIENGLNGYIIDDYNELDSYVHAIIKLIEDRDIYSKFSETGRNHVKKHDWKILSERYRSMIETVILENDYL